MGMSLSHTEWNVAMLRTLPADGNRYEVIDGELFVTPAPSVVHQIAASKLFQLLAPYAEMVGLDPLFAPTAVTFSDQREVQPDVLVIPRLPNGKHAAHFRDVAVLVLSVEILSESSKRTDRHDKRRLYQDEHVADYWIVDLDARCIERWTPDAIQPALLTKTLTWQPIATHSPLMIDLAQYFRTVLDD